MYSYSLRYESSSPHGHLIETRNGTITYQIRVIDDSFKYTGPNASHANKHFYIKNEGGSRCCIYSTRQGVRQGYLVFDPVGDPLLSS